MPSISRRLVGAEQTMSNRRREWDLEESVREEIRKDTRNSRVTT